MHDDAAQEGAGPHMAEWPLTTHLGPVGALPTAPQMARRWITTVLSEWRLSKSAETLELIASELATNVVRASGGPDGSPGYGADGRLRLLWLRLLCDRETIMLEVWDDLPAALGAPVEKHADEEDESGRGLEMVDVLTKEWGWESIPGWTGKRVWATVALKDG